MTTESEIKILEALDAAPEKKLTGEECRQAAKLTHRGWRQVESRMVRKNLVGRVFERGSPVEITFGGLRALRAQAAA